MTALSRIAGIAVYVTSIWAAAVLFVDGHAVTAALIAAVGIGFFVSPWIRPGRKAIARNKRWAILKEGSYGNNIRRLS